MQKQMQEAAWTARLLTCYKILLRAGVEKNINVQFT